MTDLTDLMEPVLTQPRELVFNHSGRGAFKTSATVEQLHQLALSGINLMVCRNYEPLDIHPYVMQLLKDIAMAHGGRMSFQTLFHQGRLFIGEPRMPSRHAEMFLQKFDPADELVRSFTLHNKKGGRRKW